MAIVECDVLVVDQNKRDQTFEEVISRQGPMDGTVIVSLPNAAEFDDETINEVLTTLGEVGEIILVRFVHYFWLKKKIESKFDL